MVYGLNIVSFVFRNFLIILKYLFQIAAGSGLCASNQKAYTQKPNTNNEDQVIRCNHFV